MASAGFVRIGRIVKPHALKGEVSVISAVDLPLSFLEGLDVWFVPPPAAGPRVARVSTVRQGPKGPLVGFEGVEDIGAADALRGAEILIKEEDVPSSLDTDEFDAVGLRVSDVDRGDLGEVVDVIVTGANDVWVVDGPFGQVLLPVIDDVVLAIDEDARVASVRLLPGLLEE
jgi:16S rRNA processing protein RimM